MRLARRHLVLCAALLATAGCERFKKRGDFVEDVAAVVTTPVHARLVVYEYDLKPECTETGVMRLRCLLQSEQQGCAFVELGETSPMAVPEGVESEGAFRCRVWGHDPLRRQVSAAPLPVRGLELVADPTGTRLAWRAAPTDGWSVFYVLDGEFLDDTSSVGVRAEQPVEGVRPVPARPPDLTIDWSAIPTLGQRAGDLLPSATGARVGKLLELVRTERGENGVASALAGAIGLRAEPAWKDAWRSLSPGAREAFHQRVRELMEDGAPDELLNALNNLPELRPKDYADVLVRLQRESLESGLDHVADGFSERPWLEALVELGDPRAGPLACEWLESAVSTQLLAGDPYESWDYALTPYEGALVAIARARTPCPWVRVALERAPCAASYRCTPSGLVQTSPAAQEEYDNAVQDALDRGVPEPPADPQHPLCSAEQAQRLLAAWSPPWKYPEADVEAPEDDGAALGDSIVESTGVLLLAAAYAQGPLPPEVELKNKRRLYRVTDKSPRDEAVDEVGTSTCLQAAMNPAPAEVACTLPASLTRLRPGGCRLEIDDARRSITLTPPKVPPAGEPGPRLRENFRHRD